MSKKLTRRAYRRRFGTLLITVIVVMMVAGLLSDGLKSNPNSFMLYWGCFGVLLIWLIGVIALDLLSIGAHYHISHKKIIEDTFGDERFQKLLKSLENEPQQDSKEESEPGGGNGCK